jgi:hypothetical protein
VLCIIFVPQYLKLAQAGLDVSLEFRHSFPPKKMLLEKHWVQQRKIIADAGRI